MKKPNERELAEQKVEETQQRALKVEKGGETSEQVVEETEEKERESIEVGKPEQEY